MWEYKRVEKVNDVWYSPSQFLQLLNNYGEEGWEVVDYWEHDFKFRVVMKRLRQQNLKTSNLTTE